MFDWALFKRCACGLRPEKGSKSCGRCKELMHLSVHAMEVRNEIRQLKETLSIIEAYARSGKYRRGEYAQLVLRQLVPLNLPSKQPVGNE
jgi:hypothetical protein